MRKMIISVIVAGVICLLNTAPALSQDCDINCSSTFSEEKTTYFNGSLCALEIKYKTSICYIRDAGGVLRQHSFNIEIIGVNEMSGGNCSGLTDEQKMEKAVRQVLFNSLNNGFQVNSPGSGYDVAVHTPSCWADYGLVGLESCTYSTCYDPCCSSTYTLKTTDTAIIATDYDDANPDYDCSDDCSGPEGAVPCENMCASHTITLNEPLIQDDYPVCANGCNKQWIFLPTNYRDFSITLNTVNPTCNTTCTFRVFFTYRMCDNPEFSPYRIEKISCTNNCDIGQVINAVYNRAIRACLKELALDVGTPNDFVIRSPACWKYVEEGIFTHCGFDDCCSKTYTVVYDDGIHQCSTQTATSGSGSCSNPCCNQCNNLPIVLGTELLKVPFLTEEMKRPNLKDYTYVRPNPATGITEIGFTSGENGLAEIEIFNSIGELILSMKTNKASLNASWKVDVSKTPPGVYLFRITLDNVLVGKNKFVISH